MKTFISGAVVLLLLTLPLAVHAVDRKDAQLAMTQADTAITSAEHADAAINAPTTLRTSRDMFANAQSAFDRRRWQESVFNAENATADANLATAQSRQHRAEAATAEIEAAVRSMREQLGLTGDQP
ncbi:MAG TPA: DUF4398 domain-containing protein [Rudaea sp.]|nr:DUF4398 domain-containing protein [Rudaea sp.]